MADHINIRIYAELNDFLPSQQRHIDIRHKLKQPRSVMDLIESLGVPHPEIDLIVVNGEAVKPNYLLHNGDRISVYPLFRSLDISAIKFCQPEQPADPIFVLDVHLGRLAGYLRMLGFDALYRHDYDDLTLAEISFNESRVLLTCDRQLLMRKKVTLGYYVHARDPQQQLQEILLRFKLTGLQKPFTRCMHCNGLTHAVSKRKIEAQLLPETKKHYNRFFQCEDCKKIYWQGTHYLNMQAMIRKLNSSTALP